MFATVAASHFPPRAVATPRPFKAAAICLSDFAPAALASAMTGATVAANVSAPAMRVALTVARAVGEARVAEGLPTGLGGGESGLRALRDQRALFLSESGVQVQQERTSEIGDQKRRLVRHQAGNEMHVTRKPIELSDDDRRSLAMPATSSNPRPRQSAGWPRAEPRSQAPLLPCPAVLTRM